MSLSRSDVLRVFISMSSSSMYLSFRLSYNSASFMIKGWATFACLDSVFVFSLSYKKRRAMRGASLSCSHC